MARRESEDSRLKRRTLLGTTAALGGALLAGCGGGGGGGGGGEEVTVSVTADSPIFDPLRTEIGVGDTVTFVNDSDTTHNLISANFEGHNRAKEWNFNTGALNPGSESSHTFDEAGIYEYTCRLASQGIHPRPTEPGGECGVVVVGDVTFNAQLPCEEG